MSIVNLSAEQLPGIVGQIGFAAGPLAGSTSRYPVLIMAQALPGTPAAGAGINAGQVYGPDTSVPMQSVNDVIALAGAGSPAHLMVNDFFTLNKVSSLYFVAVPAGSGSLAATWTLVVSVGTLTNGSVSLQVGPDLPTITSVNSSVDTATSIAQNMALNINANVNLPVTAVATSGTLVLTTKAVGARQNWLRAFAKVTSGSGVTLSQTVPSYFVGGAGEDTVGYEQVCSNLAVNGLRYYYYVPEAGYDSVDGTLIDGYVFNDQILALAGSPTFLRQRLITGSVDTVSNTCAAVLGIGDADPRSEVLCLPAGEVTPGRLAARAAAAYSAVELPPLTSQDVNFDGFGNDAGSFSLWNVPAPLNGQAMSVISQQTCTISGVTPIAVQRGGRTSIVKRVTNRFYTAGASSSTFDGRITDGGKVTICDFFTDDLTAQLVATFPRALINPDPPQGSPPAIPGVATPGLVKQVVQNLIQVYASRGLINGPQTLANLVVQIDPVIQTQIDITVGLFTSNPLHVVSLQVLQVQ